MAERAAGGHRGIGRRLGREEARRLGLEEAERRRAECAAREAAAIRAICGFAPRCYPGQTVIPPTDTWFFRDLSDRTELTEEELNDAALGLGFWRWEPEDVRLARIAERNAERARAPAAQRVGAESEEQTVVH